MKEVESSAKRGARMSQARLHKNAEKIVEASTYDREKDGAVVCISCRCPVNGVRGYPRNVCDEQIFVPAFFRLEQGINHGPKCKYNVEKTIRMLVGRSKAIRKIDREAQPILDKIGQGQKAEFRLHILMEAIQKAMYGFWRPRRPGSAISGPKTDEPIGTEYIRTPKVLKPYFRSAKGVLALMSRLQQHSNLEEWISLKYGDRAVRWDQYFFGPDTYGRLYEHLIAEREKSPAFKYSRPIAVVVKVIEGQTLAEMNNEWRIVGRSKRIVTRGKENLAIRPVLYFRDEQIARQRVQESYLLICGIPRLGKVQPSTREAYDPRVDISITVISPTQVCQYSPS